MAKFYNYQHNGPYQNGDLPQGDDDGEDSGLDHEDNVKKTNARVNKGRFCWGRGCCCCCIF